MTALGRSSRWPEQLQQQQLRPEGAAALKGSELGSRGATEDPRLSLRIWHAQNPQALGEEDDVEHSREADKGKMHWAGPQLLGIPKRKAVGGGGNLRTQR